MPIPKSSWLVEKPPELPKSKPLLKEIKSENAGILAFMFVENEGENKNKNKNTKPETTTEKSERTPTTVGGQSHHKLVMSQRSIKVRKHLKIVEVQNLPQKQIHPKMNRRMKIQIKIKL